MLRKRTSIAIAILITFTAVFLMAPAGGKKPKDQSPVLTIDAPSEYNELSGYTVSAEVSSNNEIAHVIFITPDTPTKSFIFAVPPYVISKPYSAAIGESFDLYVIAIDNQGNATKDFVTITRVPNPPDLVQSGWGISGCCFEHIDVVNQGETATAASGFYVDFYDTENPPEIGQASTFCRVLIDRSVSPGEKVFIDVINLCPYTVSSVWVQIDTDENIDESDETNNINHLQWPL